MSETVTRPKPKRPRRAVAAELSGEHKVCWPYFDRVTASRAKLKPEPARTLYAILHLLADEFGSQRAILTARGLELTESDVGHGLFLKHAASAYRMAADRLLKSFTLSDLIRAERYGMEEFSAAVSRLNSPGTSPGS